MFNFCVTFRRKNMPDEKMQSILKEVIQAKNIAITGHTRPDGDCYGSVLGLYTYLMQNKNLFKNLIVCDVFLSYNDLASEFVNSSIIQSASLTNVKYYDLLIVCDSSSVERIDGWNLLKSHAGKVINIDHHATNAEYADINYIKTVSSTCEVLFDFMDKNRISQEVAKCLYYGMLTDTGGFKFSMTGRKTMEYAGFCMERGKIDTEQVIGRAFDERTPQFYRLLGTALLLKRISRTEKRKRNYLDKKTLRDLGYVRPETVKIENIPAMLKATKGCLVSITMIELSNNILRVSLRCNSRLNVSEIAKIYNGGGHVTAAGFDYKFESGQNKKMQVNKLVEMISNQILNQIENQRLQMEDLF